MHFLARCLKLIEILEDIACSAGLFVITFLTSALVVNRYFLHYEVMWLGDFTHYLFVFTALSSIAFTTREDGHTSVDILCQLFFAEKPRAMGRYKIVIHSLTLLTLVLFHGPMFSFARRAVKFPSYGVMVPWFNTSWLILTCYGMLLLCILHTLVNIAKHISVVSALHRKSKSEAA